MGATEIRGKKKQGNILVLRPSEADSGIDKKTKNQDKKNNMDLENAKHDIAKDNSTDIHIEQTKICGRNILPVHIKVSQEPNRISS